MTPLRKYAPKDKYARLALWLGVAALITGALARAGVVSAQGGSPGTLSFSQAEYDVSEGAGNANITLTRTGGSDGAVTAKVSLTDVTTSPADYQFSPPGAITTFNSGLGPNDLVRIVSQQPDGKILIAGSFSSYNNTPRNGVARLNADGSLDTTFVPAGAAGSDVFSLALQPDGKILVGDVKSNGIARLNADGTVDMSFNPGTGSVTGSVTYAISYMALQADGKVLVGGNFSTFDGVKRNSLARLNPDGSLDTTFDTGAGAPGGSLGALLLQPDGKILVGGVFTNFGGVARSHIARLNPDGSLDTTFDTGSVVGFTVEALALEPDGKIIAGGSFPVGATFNGANPTPIVRLNPDGSRDTSFADPGLGAKFRTITIARQPDGKLVIGGTILPDVIGGQIFHSLARLNADGSNDTSFSSGIRAFSNSSVNSLSLQPDGKILVGGQLSLHPFGVPYSYLMRLEGDLFVTWGAGDAAEKDITLPVVNDSLPEEDETLTFTLTPLTGGASVGASPSATLKILDNDGQIQFTGTAFSASEGAGSVVIPVTRVGGTSVTTMVSYSVSSGTATASVDFMASKGTLTFAPGETSKNIQVTILDDNVNEGDETVNIALWAVTDGLLGTPTGQF
jgi:uncharacterized delta-60 repeat protein